MLDGHETIGLNLRNLTAHVEGTWGVESFQEILARMPPASRETFAAPVLASEWYSLEHHLDFYRCMTDVLLEGDDARNFETGLVMARRNMERFSDVFLRGDDPFYIIGRGPIAWSMFHRPSTLETERTGERSAILRIRGFPLRPIDGPFAHSLRGHFHALLERSRAADVMVGQHSCASRGDDCSEYEARWRAVESG